MAVEPVSPERCAPRFPPLPGSFAEAWNTYRRFEANGGHEDLAGVTVKSLLAAENFMTSPAGSMADLEIKLRAIAFIRLIGGKGDHALAALSVLGPAGHPLDGDVEFADYGDRVVWSALQDVIRFNREAAL